MKNNLFALALLFVVLHDNTLNAQWANLGSGISASDRALAGIFPVNENVLWGFTWHAFNFTPTHEITRSVDGGQTWMPGVLAGVSSEQFPIYIFPYDEQTAWLATTDELTPIKGNIYKTTDGGNSWQHQSSGFTGFNETPAGVYFWNENEGFAYGATANNTYNDQIAIYTTADGGENWIKVPTANMPTQLPGEGIGIWNFAGFFSVVGDAVWFGTTKNRIFKSADRGMSWQAFSTPIANLNFNFIASVTFKDSQTGLALAYNPLTLIRSTDGGANWTDITPAVPTSFRGTQIEYIPGTQGTWIMSPSPTHYMVSYNDGSTWETHASNVEPWSLEFLNSKTGFASSYITSPTSGGAYKWTGPALGNRFFVNDDATGLNNGSSWANAFTHLEDALASASDGDQIWVAEGRYQPDVPNGSRDATFLLDKNIRFYGGFEGTESNLSDRGDPALHPSILSGDLNGDDEVGNLEKNKIDNVYTVLTAESNVSKNAIIDGFIIQGGYSDGNGIPEGRTRSGGGIYATGIPQIIGCLFRENYAIAFGGGCYFHHQTNLPAVEINHCKFLNNKAIRGGGLRTLNSNLLISDCIFFGNEANQYGGGMYCGTTIASQNIEVLDCTFEENRASLGGGTRLEVQSDSNQVLVRNCSFTKNAAAALQEGWGQAGGGLNLAVGPDATNSYASFESCQFFQNVTALTEVNGGGAYFLFTYGKNTVINIQDNTIEENSSVYGGGIETVASGGGHMDLTITNTLFASNQAVESGALDLYEDSDGTIKVQLNRCTFNLNNTSISGSAISYIPNTNGLDIKISRCKFLDNSCPFGGTLTGYTLSNTLPFQDSVKVAIENSLFANNLSDAVIAHSSIGALSLLNCTLAENQSAGIQLDNQSGLSLQNTILYNPGYAEYQEVDGDVTLVSQGGNLVGDNSLNDILLPNDKQNLNPMFVGNGDYHVAPGSPCIDMGVDLGNLPAFDLDGNARVFGSAVDIGAFESLFTPTRDLLTEPLEVSPNPASGFIKIQLPEDKHKQAAIQVFDATGRLCHQQSLGDDRLLDIQNLAPGTYSIEARLENQVYVGKFLKH